MKVLQFPLARITFWFVFGILASFYLHPSLATAFILLIISALVFGLAYFFSRTDFQQKVYFGIFLYIVSFCIGITTQVVHTDSNQQSNYIHQITSSEEEHLVEIVLREKLKSSTFNDRYIAIVKRLDDKRSTGKILINFHKNTANEKLQIGSNIQVQSTVFKHTKPHNPNQFDYGQYLTNKSVLAQMYADADNIKISSNIDKNIWYYTDRLRTRILSNLQKSNFNKTELPVVAALILGQQQDISPEILRDYQFAGAIHILSVSGLHVGFILLFITFSLQWLPKNKSGNLIRLLSVIISLWSFALIAGLSPSVVRSVTMFSFVAVGMHLKRRTNIFHTLLVSILLILLFQPSFLFDVGFQLSYVALFFILWLQPLLANLWIPKNKITKYFWDILTVSFAAQIGAFPLSVYYFHQFPGLFFVTNLIIIPFLSVIMALGVLVMVLAAFNYVPELPAKLLEGSIYYLNKIINWVASFEQFIIQDISFNWYMLSSLYLLIVAAIIWLKKPHFNKLALMVITLILYQLSYFGAQWNTQNQKEWIVFNIKKNTIITERTGENTVIYCSDSIQQKLPENQTIKSYLVGNFSKIKKYKRLPNMAFFNTNKILILDSLGVYPSQVKPDVLVITNSPRINLERLFQTFRPKTVVADASNYKTYIACWKATCIKEKIPFHSTSEKGFYRLK